MITDRDTRLINGCGWEHKEFGPKRSVTGTIFWRFPVGSSMVGVSHYSLHQGYLMLVQDASSDEWRGVASTKTLHLRISFISHRSRRSTERGKLPATLVVVVVVINGSLLFELFVLFVGLQKLVLSCCCLCWRRWHRDAHVRFYFISQSLKVVKSGYMHSNDTMD